MTSSRKRKIQIALGLVWLADGILQMQPKMFGNGFLTQVIDPAAQGQPSLIAGAINKTGNFVQPHVSMWNLLFAAVQVPIGIGMLSRQTVKPAIALSVAWSLGVWSFGEGFGMLLTGSATALNGAPGAVLLYAIIGILVWPKAVATEELLSHKNGLRIWSVLWVGSGVLFLLPGNSGSDSISRALSSAAGNVPGPIAGIDRSLSAGLMGHGTQASIVLAVVSAVIGLGPILTKAPNLFLMFGAALSLDFWVTGQALGGLFTGTATDPNAGPLFVLLATALAVPAELKVLAQRSNSNSGGFLWGLPTPVAG